MRLTFKDSIKSNTAAAKEKIGKNKKLPPKKKAAANIKVTKKLAKKNNKVAEFN